ncbi:YchJ family metal-binding protein [Actinosynnema sp. NPDC047251]|uniref:YchJ family protein n=1 Tax=Saccharothrix espanaensis TaxID=103731 RepID=UPI000310B228|nr:YchJ family metal-binding protein [Saccharothrix espanaensis]
MTCPCGLGEPYETCCGALHSGLKTAPTAEALMRSRYAAFAVADEPYLLSTWHPTTRPGELDLDPDQKWLRLEVLARTGGGLLHTTGTVEFRAIYRWQGRREELHENSRFVRDDGRWLYLEPVRD